MFFAFFRTILAIVVFLTFFIFGIQQLAEFPKVFYPKIELPKINDEKKTAVEIKTEPKREIVVETRVKSPPVLKVVKEEPKIDTSILTTGGVISWTNFFRQTNGLTSLKESADLNKIALRKLTDMFQKQYFEHVSPAGEGIGDVAKKESYKFVLIGENLALGDFVDDEDVVRAWMNSPGHRANILKPSYVEIGVAAQKGLFNGREVWLSVQIFSVPLSFCKSPENGLLEKIESNKAQLKSTKEHLDLLRSAIEEKKYQTREEYEKMVAEHNLFVGVINLLSSETKALTEQYNKDVALFNQCVDSFE